MISMYTSNQGYSFPSLTRTKSTLTGKLKKTSEEFAPKVNIQGRKCLVVEDGCEETGSKNSSKASSKCESRVSLNELCNDDNSYTTVASIGNFPSTKLSALEGRKINIRILDKTTLKRVKRLKNLRLQETNEIVDSNKNGCHQIAQQHARGHSSQDITKNINKSTPKRVFELPKVESYEILTPNQIISSEACQVFREKTTPRTTDLTNTKIPATDSCSSKRKTIFDKVEANTIEFRNPSPVRGMKLNPREELECIEKALEIVEKNNLTEKRPNFSSEISESFPVIKKFVVHLPPIY